MHLGVCAFLCVVNSSKRRYLFDSSQAVSATAKPATPVTASSSYVEVIGLTQGLIVMLSIQLYSSNYITKKEPKSDDHLSKLISNFFDHNASS